MSVCNVFTFQVCISVCNVLRPKSRSSRQNPTSSGQNTRAILVPGAFGGLLTCFKKGIHLLFTEQDRCVSQGAHSLNGKTAKVDIIVYFGCNTWIWCRGKDFLYKVSIQRKHTIGARRGTKIYVLISFFLQVL